MLIGYIKQYSGELKFASGAYQIRAIGTVGIETEYVTLKDEYLFYVQILDVNLLIYLKLKNEGATDNRKLNRTALEKMALLF